LLDAWQKSVEQPGGEPDWSDSETQPSELWKNPLLDKTQRLLMADGAVHFRDQVIENLRVQLAAKTPASPRGSWVEANSNLLDSLAQGVASASSQKAAALYVQECAIYEDVYEQLCEMVEPHVTRPGQSGWLPASVVDSVGLLLANELARRTSDGLMVSVPRDIAERMAADAAQYDHEHAIVNDNVQLWQQPSARLSLTVGDLRAVRALLAGGDQ
jgi:hypothetical protein